MKICSLLLLFIVTLHAQDKSGTWAQKRTIPRWAQQEFKSHSLGRNYAVTYQLYPSYFRGDFNGDGRRDAVILVAQNSTGKLGMLFIHGKYPQDMRTAYYILGAGKAFGFGDDMDRPLIKSDGSYTYFAADIAYHRDKRARGWRHHRDRRAGRY